MPTQIIIRTPENQEVINDMVEWLRKNVGDGSFRSIPNSFMGMDDWYYYDNLSYLDDESDEPDDFDDTEVSLVFKFRRESDATMFALKWTP